MNQINPSTPDAAGGFDLNRPTVIALLYLACFLTAGISTLVGLVLAYVWKEEPGEEWMNSHYSFHIRTFWYGLVGGIISTILSLILIGLIGYIALAVWAVVRTVLAMMKAQRREALANPSTLVW